MVDPGCPVREREPTFCWKCRGAPAPFATRGAQFARGSASSGENVEELPGAGRPGWPRAREGVGFLEKMSRSSQAVGDPGGPGREREQEFWRKCRLAPVPFATLLLEVTCFWQFWARNRDYRREPTPKGAEGHGKERRRARPGKELGLVYISPNSFPGPVGLPK